MADENISLLVEVFKHYDISNELLTKLKCNTRLFIAYVTTLLEKLEKDEIDIQSDEIRRILSDKANFSTKVDCVKNQLEEIKNKLEHLHLEEIKEGHSKQLRENRGRKKSNADTSVDSGFASATSNVLTESTLFNSLNLQDDIRNKEVPVQDTVPHTAESTYMNDMFVLPQEPLSSNPESLKKTQSTSMPVITIEHYKSSGENCEDENIVCEHFSYQHEDVKNSNSFDELKDDKSLDETVDSAARSTELGTSVTQPNAKNDFEMNELHVDDVVQTDVSEVQNNQAIENEDTTHSTVIK